MGIILAQNVIQGIISNGGILWEGNHRIKLGI